jgi:hypothetical protein
VGDFRFTLFNDVTLFIMALTMGALVWRLKGRIDSNWPLVYWAIVLAYALAFHYSLNLYWILAGAALGLIGRFARHRLLRCIELPAFVYVWWRALGLLLGW